MKRLFSTTCIPDGAGTKNSPFLRRFAQEEDGNVTILSLFFIAIMILLAGISWDLNSHEYHRVKVQGTADRAVLAAADLDQTDPKAVVDDYFETVGYPDLITNVNPTTGLNFRTVSVSVEGTVSASTIRGNYDGEVFEGGRARFDAEQRAAARIEANRPEDAGLSDADILEAELASARTTEENAIMLRAFAEAEERVTNVEISMVLDISGSMGLNDKMANLREAANNFVDTVITPQTEDLVSISIVPYSEDVSAGAPLMNQFNVNQVHNFSHCIDFEDSDFDTTRISRTTSYDQVQHYFWANSETNNLTNPVCLFGEHESIRTFSQDTDALKTQINGLVPRGNTSIHLGMKWAAALLDPDFQQINANLAALNHSDPAFVTRPAAFDDPTTLKTVILMTDGLNTHSRRIRPFAYSNSSHYEHWNKNNFDWWLNNNVHPSQHNQWSKFKYWTVKANGLLDNICDAAKDQNIVIWSIGFEVTDASADIMRNCASSPSHFFRVEGVQINEAFSAIARQIHQLRLTQ